MPTNTGKYIPNKGKGGGGGKWDKGGGGGGRWDKGGGGGSGLDAKGNKVGNFL